MRRNMHPDKAALVNELIEQYGVRTVRQAALEALKEKQLQRRRRELTAVLLAQLDARRAEKRASDEEVTRLAGMTPDEFDADTTAPDPVEDEG